MKISDLLEAPLVDIKYYRHDKKGSLNDRDRKILAKYMKDRVYHEKLKKLPFDLYVYVIDDSELYDFGATTTLTTTTSR